MDKKDLLLTQEDYEALGLTEEQIALFEDANAIVGSVDLLPDNPAVMIDAIDKLPADYATALKALDEMSATNPEAFTRLMTMVSLVTDVYTAPPLEVDPVLDKLSQESLDKAEREFYEMIKALSPERKKEFFALLNNISTEQKAELVDTLVNR